MWKALLWAIACTFLATSATWGQNQLCGRLSPERRLCNRQEGHLGAHRARSSSGAETSWPNPDARSCPVGKVQVQQDRFSGAATATTSLNRLWWLAPTLIWNSQLPDEVSLVVSSQSEDWRYLKCHSTHVLVDGKKLPLGAADHDGDVLGAGSVLERIVVPILWADRSPLKNMEQFEYKVCNDESEADTTFVCEARDLIRAVEDWKKVKGKSL